MEGSRVHWMWYVGFVLLHIHVVLLQFGVTDDFSNLWIYPMCFATFGAFALYYTRCSKAATTWQRVPFSTLFLAFAVCFWITYFAVGQINTFWMGIGSRVIFCTEGDWKEALRRERFAEAPCKAARNPLAYVYWAFVAFGVAALVEEIVKGWVTRLSVDYYLPHKSQLSPRYFKVYAWMGFAVGMGFEVSEIILYACLKMAGNRKGQWTQVVLRGLIPFHALWGMLWGIGLAKRRLLQQPLGYVRIGWKQWLTHGLWDLICFFSPLLAEFGSGYSVALSALLFFVLAPAIFALTYFEFRRVERMATDKCQLGNAVMSSVTQMAPI